ncbi:Fc receptor-like protein 3 isoform X3 [Trichechus manatus latirostris]|uniref:Fc receptor-like protein 3 isoform X3 n=1 Tax=Trichechus manatus latirostris TaxID=127582 RepID=A0A2Y9QDT5_TRIMA|nr:Fc receptor-like protein 3 isoform X3 [Trichechus manatus latirostris]
MRLCLLLLLILAPGGEQSGEAPKAMVLLQPTWFPVFKGQTVTLTCKGSHSPALGDTSWYHEKKLLKEDSEELQVEKSGKYKCKTKGSSLSDPMDVVFVSGWLILQASYPVFEGDNVDLRCQGKEDNEIIDRIYYKDKKKLDEYENKKCFTLFSVSRDNGEYYCIASGENAWTLYEWTEHSNHLRIQVQELFSPPKLTARPSKPIEGRPVALKCETWLPPQRSHIQLQFCFFRGSQALGAGWSRSPALQIPTMWTEDSGSYWCEAQTISSTIRKRSLPSQIYVQRIPVSDVNLEVRAPGGQVIEGEDLVLVCSVAKGTGTITFSWHREGRVSLGRKTERSLRAELPVLAVKESDAGRYYCTADNVHGPILSKWIAVIVRVPVSRPVLTLWTPRAQGVVGDVVELHCEAQRGSPPILYRFYHEDVILGNNSAPSGGRVSFNLSLTAEHSGNYSCEADNGLRAQRSHQVTLNVTVPSRNTAGVVGGLLSILGFAAAAAVLLYYFRTQRKSGGIVTGTPGYRPNESSESSLSRPSGTGPQELELVYRNENPEDSNLLYSQILIIQQAKGNSANSSRLHQEDKEPPVIYSELKKARPEDSPGQADSRDRDHEDATEYYENVPCTSSALDH